RLFVCHAVVRICSPTYMEPSYLLTTQRRPRSTLFPYTTLFRSHPENHRRTVSGDARHSHHSAVSRAARRVHIHPRCRETRNCRRDRKSTRLNSSHEWISYAVFCLKKKE